AFALDRDLAEIDRTDGGKLVEEFSRLRMQQQHRVAEMPAGALAREHVGEEDALVDLVSFLITLQERVFGRDLLARRHEARNGGGGFVDEVFEPGEAGAVESEQVVEGLHMRMQEFFALCARDGTERLRCGRFGRSSRRFRWQASQEIVRAMPEIDEPLAIAVVLGRAPRLGCEPSRHRASVEPACVQTLGDAGWRYWRRCVHGLPLTSSAAGR